MSSPCLFWLCTQCLFHQGKLELIVLALWYTHHTSRPAPKPCTASRLFNATASAPHQLQQLEVQEDAPEVKVAK